MKETQAQKVSMHELKLATLSVLETAPPRGLNKFNLIGRPQQHGDLELRLGVQFDGDERHLAARAFDELRSSGFIRPTYADIAAPGDWVLITEAGREALKHGALDDLDRALERINPYLLEIRRGAWAALGAPHSDSLRQAAHSARELIEQVLKDGAPDEAILAQPDFQRDPSTSSGITRRMRLRFLMRKHRGSDSDSDLALAEAAGELVLATDAKLQALSHNRTAPFHSQVRESLEIAEKMLRRVLVGVI